MPRRQVFKKSDTNNDNNSPAYHCSSDEESSVGDLHYYRSESPPLNLTPPGAARPIVTKRTTSSDSLKAYLPPSHSSSSSCSTCSSTTASLNSSLHNHSNSLSSLPLPIMTSTTTSAPLSTTTTTVTSTNNDHSKGRRDWTSGLRSQLPMNPSQLAFWSVLAIMVLVGGYAWSDAGTNGLSRANANSRVGTVDNRPPVWVNQHNLVHIVHTRFMQHQPHLSHLGEIRMDLLKTFTMTSLLHQTNREFLWILWVDPQLDPHLKRSLLELFASMGMSPHQAMIVAHERLSGDFRLNLNGLPRVNQDTVWFGNPELLVDYHRQAQTRVVLETRLDADDSIHGEYVALVQARAAATIVQSEQRDDYRAFCSMYHWQWRYYTPDEKIPDRSEGFLIEKYHSEKECVTPGLTFALQVEAKLTDMPTRANYELDDKFQHCNRIPRQCAERLSHPKQERLSLWCRTPSSTSMISVVTAHNKPQIQDEGHEGEDEGANDPVQILPNKAFKELEKQYGVSKKSIVALRDHFEEDMKNILGDALKGQCKMGHSCRGSSQQALKDLLGQYWH